MVHGLCLEEYYIDVLCRGHTVARCQAGTSSRSDPCLNSTKPINLQEFVSVAPHHLSLIRILFVGYTTSVLSGINNGSEILSRHRIETQFSEISGSRVVLFVHQPMNICESCVLHG